jgi:hypothetical protein
MSTHFFFLAARAVVTHSKRGALAGALVTLAACGGRNLDVSDGTGSASVLGSPCVPLTERDPRFAGGDQAEVSIDPGSPQCGSPNACVSDHFQGRVTCPYGSDAGTPSCTVPGGGEAVSVPVLPQCTDRLASDTVYCTCRCANAAGRNDDGASYCDCPGWMACQVLVAPIGIPSDDALAGSYCVKPSTAYDPGIACATTCNPSAAPCP